MTGHSVGASHACPSGWVRVQRFVDGLHNPPTGICIPDPHTHPFPTHLRVGAVLTTPSPSPTVLPKSAVDVRQLIALHDSDFDVTDSGWKAWFAALVPGAGMTKAQIDDMTNWEKFVITWDSFKNSPSLGGQLSSDDQYNLVVDYLGQLQGWRDELVKQGGTITGPPIQLPSKVEPPSLPQIIPSSLGFGLGLAAVALGAIYLLKK